MNIYGENGIFSLMSDYISKAIDHITVSKLMNHSEKYKLPFHVLIVTELAHEYFYNNVREKEEVNILLPKIIFDNPRPIQLLSVKNTLKPIRGITAEYDDDPYIDCNDGILRYTIRSDNRIKNLENFLKIKQQGNTLLDTMSDRLHKDIYIKKLVEKNIDYYIHKENNVVPPKDLSFLNKQYQFYIKGNSIEESTELAINSTDE